MEARTLYLVKRAETACRSGLEECLSELGITPSQYTTMSLLASHRNQSSADLARRTGVTPQSMSEIISVLEKKIYIVRNENPEHRRILTIQLTDAGLGMLRQCDELADKLEERLLEGLVLEDIERLRGALDRIARNSQTR